MLSFCHIIAAAISAAMPTTAKNKISQNACFIITIPFAPWYVLRLGMVHMRWFYRQEICSLMWFSAHFSNRLTCAWLMPMACATCICV